MKPAILLVEDNDNDVFFMRRAFEAAGVDHPVVVATDGQKAIDYLNHAASSNGRDALLPCLILLDLKLPVVSGLDVLRWIREQPSFKDLVVVILSSSHMDSDIDQAYHLNANSFLVKPTTTDQLKQMVVVIKEYWLNLNRPPSKCVPDRVF